MKRRHPNRSESDHTEQNQGIHHQTVSWNLNSSEILCSLEWKLLPDVSGQPTGPFFKGQNIQKTKHSIHRHSLIFWDFVYRRIV
jgi:hypothetical protein